MRSRAVKDKLQVPSIYEGQRMSVDGMFEVGDTVVLTVGKGRKRQILRVVAVTEPDKLGRLRTRRAKRRKKK